MTPQLVGQAEAYGGAKAWFEGQLTPAKISDVKASAMRAWYPLLDYEAGEKYDADSTGARTSWATDDGPRPLDGGAPHRQPTAAARGDDRVLVQPAARPAD